MRINLYDSSKINKDALLFTPADIWKIIVPVMIEQFLASFMGMADTMMVARVGKAAISAVSLVDSINILIIQVFAALATGATVICSQYIGKRDEKTANDSASQIILVVTTISLVLSAICIFFRAPLLNLIFGKVDADIMEASLIYMLITAISFPFIALSQAGSACLRACGDSKFPMRVSVIANIINVIGNYILIFIFHMGVTGAAYATLLSRIFNMLFVLLELRKSNHAIVVRDYLKIRPNGNLIQKILLIGIPSGIENGMFQFGKLAIQSSVSTLGATAIAAQAMTNTLENLSGIACIGIGIGLMTVVGQAIGAGRDEEARYYICRLTLRSQYILIASVLFVFALTKPVLWVAGMDAEAATMCFTMTLAITIVKPVIWNIAFIPSYGMRAAGDVKFFMLTSCVIMWGARVALAVFLIRVMGWGPMAVWVGMFVDWFLRACVNIYRYLSGKWLAHKVV